MISIIIPTWNEEASLPETLAAIQAAAPKIAHEVIVVDGGSTDQTVTIAREHGHKIVQSSTPDRAFQQNLGAAQASGTILWFLHADTWIPRSSLAQIESTMHQPEIVGGGFARQFRSASPFLWLTCRLAQLRSQWFELYFGDQAIFVRATVFRELEGFREMPVFEDFDLCQRMRTLGKLQLLRPAIRTSARRFASRGSLLVTLHDLWLTLQYLVTAKR